MTGQWRVAVTGMLLMALVCAGGGCAALKAGNHEPDLVAASGTAPPTLTELELALNRELARLGVDPAKATSAPADDEQDRVPSVAVWYNDPDGPGGQPALVYFGWFEFLTGDYDENGEVNVGDLTPLGQHWGETVAYQPSANVGGLEWIPSGESDNDGGVPDDQPPTPDSGAANWRRARIDGDFNGELNISDITPIAQNWHEGITGYRVMFTPAGNPDDEIAIVNPDDPALPYSVHRDRATGFPNRPILYSFTTEYPAGEAWARYWVVPWDEASGQYGIPSAKVEVRADGSFALVPVAVLTATPDGGVVPLDVTWDASGSYGREAIIKYEWDTNHDPTTFEVDGGANPVYQVTYNHSGTQWMSVRITDAVGMTEIATKSVEVAAGGGNEAPQAAFTVDVPEGQAPLDVTFDPTGSADPDGSVTQYRWDFEGDGTVDRIDYSAAIFHRQYSEPGEYQATLVVEDDQGATDAAVQTITAHGWATTTVGEYTCGQFKLDAAVVDGRPALAFATQLALSPGGVYYTLADDPTGKQWHAGTSTLYESASTGFGGPVSLEVVDGRPAVAYIAFDKSVNYRRAVDAAGDTWTNPAVQVDPGPADYDVELSDLQALAAVAYRGVDALQGNVYYQLATDAAGSAWQAANTAYTGSGADTSLSLAVFTDSTNQSTFPLLSHVELFAQQLLFQHATAADGMTWTPAASPDPAGWCGSRASLAIVDGKPALAYYGNTPAHGDGLYLALATYYPVAANFAWDAPIRLVMGADQGRDCCLSPIGTNYGVAFRALGGDLNWRLGYVTYFMADIGPMTMQEVVEPDTEIENGLEAVIVDLGGRPGIAHAQLIPNGFRLKFSSRW